MKLLKLLTIPCVLFASCVKEDEAYDQMYQMYYYKHTDSYRLEAILDGGDGEPMLNKKESITANGQGPTGNEPALYYWEGQGMPDVTVVLKQAKNQYTNTT